eukprot:1642295-Pyramimonas_sp.AAC.1
MWPPSPPRRRLSTARPLGRVFGLAAMWRLSPHRRRCGAARRLGLSSPAWRLRGRRRRPVTALSPP